jgi:hypothetical protein
VRLVSLAWIAVALFGWWSVLAVQWDDDPAMIRRDYYCFFRAGELFLLGEDPFSQEDHAFVNPPFTLPMVIGLSWAGLRGSYVVLAMLGALGWLAGCVLATRFGEASEERRATLVFALLTAPCAFLALHLGQLSGIYFLILAGTLLLFSRGHDRGAGALGALLLAKPNFLVAVVLAAFVLKRPRFLIALGAGALALVLFSLPFGLEAWVDCWHALSRLAHRHDTVAADYWKQFTVYAFFRAVLFGVDASGIAARLVTGAVLLGFGAAILSTLRRHRARWGEPGMAARLASILVLATCALNTYLFFYDAVFLALPAATLFVADTTWARPRLRMLAIVSMALSWLLQVEVAFIHENPPLAGVVAALWLVLELVDLHEARPLEGSSVPSPSGVHSDAPSDARHLAHAE